MKQIYKIEIRRAFLNKRMLFALTAGIIICAVHFVQWLPTTFDYLKTPEGTILSFYPANVFSEWICSNNYNWEQYVYFLIFPLLACIPYGASLYDDWNGGYAKNIIIKRRKRDYFRAKWLAVFLSGGVSVTVPLILNFLAFLTIAPVNKPEIASLFYAVGGDNILAPLFYHYPFAYLILYMCIDFIYGGILSGICLMMTNMTQRRFVVEVTPLFIYIFLYAVIALMSEQEYSPVSFLNMGSGTMHYAYMMVFALVVAGVITVYVEYSGRKGELY